MAVGGGGCREVSCEIPAPGCRCVGGGGELVCGDTFTRRQVCMLGGGRSKL